MNVIKLLLTLILVSLFSETSFAVEEPKPALLGPEDAQIKIVEYSDFHCIFCKRVHPALQQLMTEYEGKVQREFRHFPLRVTPNSGSFVTHTAALCAQEQGQFWAFHNAIYSHPTNPTREELSQFAKKLNLNKKAFETCTDSGKYNDYLKASRTEGVKAGVEGTPFFLINNSPVQGGYPYGFFRHVVEHILNPKEVPRPAGLGRNPGERVHFENLEGFPSQGPIDAPVLFVEFGDFHCPYCAKANDEVNRLMKEHPDKVRRVFRHFPLPYHPGALQVHEASACAHEQGRFWEFHEEVFGARPAVQGMNQLKRVAAKIDLEKKSFTSCLESRKYEGLVASDIQEGVLLGVQGTPTFFVNGRFIVGAQPYAVLEELLNSELKKVKS